jgi:DNA polymerase III epsilon subunit-like protein
MKYAVIDTETSGLFDFSKPADAEGQPRLAHLSMILLEEDESEHFVDFLVKPDGWEIGEEAAAINGLTMEHLNEHGVPVADVLARYVEAIDAGYIMIAFNAQFDLKMMRGELRRAGIDDRFEVTPNICIMRASTDVVCVPKKAGKGYKFPKLSEACTFFEITNEGEHTADGDARAALQIFRKLRELGKLPEPNVFFAKTAPEGKTEAAVA